jgi:serine/threonine protein kinase
MSEKLPSRNVSDSERETLPPPSGDRAVPEAATLPPASNVHVVITTLPPGERPSEPPASQRTLQVPGFEILGELGRGGMGVVYKAKQVAANRIVALKMILSGGAAGPAELARFKTEVEAVARGRSGGGAA